MSGKAGGLGSIGIRALGSIGIGALGSIGIARWVRLGLAPCSFGVRALCSFGVRAGALDVASEALIDFIAGLPRSADRNDPSSGSSAFVDFSSPGSRGRLGPARGPEDGNTGAWSPDRHERLTQTTHESQAQPRLI